MMNLDTTNSHPYLAVKKSKRGGRGVFAKTSIPKGTAFLVDPVIFLEETDCANYIFMDRGKVFIGLGYSSLINHGKPNCYWDTDFSSKNMPTMTFYALNDIKKNEELLHSYEWPEYPLEFV